MKLDRFIANLKTQGRSQEDSNTAASDLASLRVGAASLPPVCSGQTVNVLAADIPQLAMATSVGAETPLHVKVLTSLNSFFPL